MNRERPLTCLITKGDLTPEDYQGRKGELLGTIAAAAGAGISIVQLREKRLTGKQMFELTRDAVKSIDGSRMKLLINGRPDIAAAAGAHGVHLPEAGLPIAAVRRGFPFPFIIGASVHSIERGRCAKDEGADFVVYGPVFDSGEKKGKGIDGLEAVCTELDDFPVIALGGIDSSNLDQVLRAGVAGYAAIRYLNHLVSER
jgi:thiamine-phosphate pyrophosphorylase